MMTELTSPSPFPSPFPSAIASTDWVLSWQHGLLFGACSKLEGDLKRVEVDLKSGPTLLDTRVVDFNDKSTVNEAHDDRYTFNDKTLG